ncbi:leucine-rich repeat and immunoglobulin-like domain-containing nogo receptor-interacting protein 1, partial [Solea senegalensis]
MKSFFLLADRDGTRCLRGSPSISTCAGHFSTWWQQMWHSQLKDSSRVHSPAAVTLSCFSDNLLAVVDLEAFLGLENLLTLRLARNRLKIIPVGAFAGLSNLQFLDISSNEILVFLDFAFRDLVALRYISAADNDLVFISRQAFSGLTSLQEMHLDACNLTAVPTEALTPIRGNLLGDLLRLQELHLVGGSLLHIELGAFRGLMNFRLLNVSRNLLTTLESGVFQSVDTLKTLRLDNNPLACDCRLLWVVRRHLYLDFGKHSPTCTTSLQLEDWTFLDFSGGELQGLLTCRQPRILNRNPQRVIVDQGHTVMFYCNAEGDPLPRLTWLNPQLKALSPTGRIRALTNGSLEVRYAQPQDSGTYHCVASNAAGNDSLPVSLHVRAFPSSHKKPFPFQGWFELPSASPGVNENQKLPFDVKTLLIAAAIGFLSFFSSKSNIMSLVVGRQPRKTAGNRMSKLLDAEEEDEFYKTTYGGFND